MVADGSMVIYYEIMQYHEEILPVPLSLYLFINVTRILNGTGL